MDLNSDKSSKVFLLIFAFLPGLFFLYHSDIDTHKFNQILKELAVVEYALLCALSLTLYLCSLWSGDEKKFGHMFWIRCSKSPSWIQNGRHEQPISSNISAPGRDRLMKMVAIPTFSWSRIPIMSVSKMSDGRHLGFQYGRLIITIFLHISASIAVITDKNVV